MHHSLASGVLLRLPGGGANFVLCLLAPGHFVFILTADWKQRKHKISFQHSWTLGNWKIILLQTFFLNLYLFFLRKFIFHKLFQLPYMHAFKIFDAKTSLSFYKKCVWEAERETECSRPVVHSPNAHKALGSAHHTIQASHTVNRNPVELSPLPSRVSVSTKVELGAGARRYTLVPWCGRYVLNFLHASS